MGGEAAVVGDSEVEGVDDDRAAGREGRVGRLDDTSGQVDSRDEGVDPGHLAGGGAGEAVFVVDARIGDLDEDVALAEVVDSEVDDATGPGAGVVVADGEGANGGHLGVPPG